MKISIKRAAVVGLTGAVVAAGGGIAIAQGTGGDRDKERQAYLDSAAKRLNTTPDKLEAALEGAWQDRLDAAVKAGRLTQKQADAIKERAKDGPGFGGPPIGRGFGGPGFGGPGFGPGGFGGPAVFMEGFEAAAKYLGLSEAKLRAQLADGKSLADVAKAQNKDTAGLKAALKAFATDELAAAVKAGDLTQAQADEITQRIDEHLDDLIAGDLPGPRGPGGRGPGHGPGGFGPGFFGGRP
jgi:hypothetical protein